MTEKNEIQGTIVDIDKLPENFPTHLHNSEFWENLGRTIATFGFLEKTLRKAIVSFEIIWSSQKHLEDKVEKALVSPLSALIELYKEAVCKSSDEAVKGLDELVNCLQKASAIRNVLCHGSWKTPDEAGRSTPLFVNKKNGIFDHPVDISFLKQTQQHVAKLACEVINMEQYLLSSNSPGKPIMSDKA